MIVWGRVYPSVDHAYQASKATEEAERELVRTRPTPLAAWQTGQAIRKNRHWMSNREKMMLSLLKIKFSDPELQAKLIATGSAELVFLHHRDSWWGKSTYSNPAIGGNRLGLALTETRKFYRPFKRNILV